MDSIAGITWERLERESSVTYPCEKVGDPGEPVVFIDNFPTESGRGKFVPADLISAAERPDDGVSDGAHHRTATGTLAHGFDDAARFDAGFALSRSRWRRCIRWIWMRSAWSRAGLLTIESRRGSITLYARADDGTPRGAVFVPFCFYEAAANMLTNPVLDPFGKIPEFKYCAVKLSGGGAVPEHLSFGGGVLLPERLPVPAR